MSGFSRHRPALVPCLVALALLLAMSMKPVLDSLGELHDLSHAPLGGHARLGHASGHDGDLVAQAESDEEGGGGLQALLHSVHCAGHSVLVALADFPCLAVVPTCDAQPPDESQHLPVSPPRAPYRPPIFA